MKPMVGVMGPVNILLNPGRIQHKKQLATNFCKASQTRYKGLIYRKFQTQNKLKINVEPLPIDCSITFSYLA